MRRTIVLGLLLLTLPAWAQANTITGLSVVGACTEKATQARRLIESSAGPEVEVLIVCYESDWRKLLYSRDLSLRTAAFTILAKRTIIVLGPAVLKSPQAMSYHIRHEMAHVRCGCDLGETLEHWERSGP